MRAQKIVAVGALASALALLAGACGTGQSTVSSASASSAAKPSIIIGSENFPENEVVAYVYGDALSKAGFSVTVKPNLGSREVLEPALDSGQINVTPEYVGNYLSYLDPSVGTLSIPATVAKTKSLIASKGLVLGTVSPAADSDAIAVTQATAKKYHLTSIADLKKYAPQWTFGEPPECATRITCVPGLKKYYGVTFKSFKPLDEDGPLTVSALEGGQVQVARIFSSDATITQDHFVVLSDPKDFQGAGNLIPVLSKSVATPAVLKVLNKVSATMQTSDLVHFNLLVGSDHDQETQVASQYVAAKKL